MHCHLLSMAVGRALLSFSSRYEVGFTSPLPFEVRYGLVVLANEMWARGARITFGEAGGVKACPQ